MPAGAGRWEGGGAHPAPGKPPSGAEEVRGAADTISRQQTGDTRTHLAMETLTIKDIPREMLIKDSLKGELLGDRKLRPTEAAEKNVLPSAEDVQTEKKHQSILNGK